MDNSMIKRGIGAVVLAVIAALLLGWLLKDKSQERQELADIKIPSTSELNIPSLTDAVDKVSEGATNIVEGTKEKVAEAGNTVVAAATGTMDSLKNTADSTKSSVTDSVTNGSSEKPGFSIRPPQQNETKEIVDNIEPNSKTTKTTDTDEPAKKVVEDNTVVASTKKKASFTPQIIEKKKSTKVTKKTQEPKKKVAKKVTPTSPTTNATDGKYSIQLLATSSQTRAKKLADVMTSEGYKSFITQTQRSGKLLYRVRVGGYGERNKAIKAQEGMKKRYQKNFFVQNSLVVSK